VVEGEIDMRLGIPARHGKMRGVVNSYDILTMHTNTFLYIPPGVFFPESGAHWERVALPVPDSQLFWLHVMPTGALCHTCTTRNGIHIFDNYDVFVPDTQLPTLAEILSDELQSAEPDSYHSASSALLLLLLRVRNGLRRSEATNSPGEWNAYGKGRLSKMTRPEAAALSTNPAIVEKACKYIQKNLSHDIDQVASHVYVSSSHLTKLFRTYLNTTVNKYVLDQRMEVARSFLLNTEISIKEIARFTGYKQPPQFNRVFKQVHHLTPKEFRQKNQSAEN
jgi:AraC-like DNA-binding protein